MRHLKIVSCILLFILFPVVRPLIVSAEVGVITTTIEPGEPYKLTTSLNINIIFVGIDEQLLDETLFIDSLQSYYAPVLRIPNMYLGSYVGNPPVYLGLNFTLNYSMVYAEESFEIALVDHLTEIGRLGNATIHQNMYVYAPAEGEGYIETRFGRLRGPALLELFTPIANSLGEGRVTLTLEDSTRVTWRVLKYLSLDREALLLCYNAIYGSLSITVRGGLAAGATVVAKGERAYFTGLITTSDYVEIEESLYIPAEAVEEWLMENMDGYFPDLPEGYTLFILNLLDALPFHVYFAGEPDPDTGFPIFTLDNRMMSSWGGGLGRVWFYDISSGPEIWAGNAAHILSSKPPVWEYTDPSELTMDLADVTRFVAVDMLFTPSPVYKPLAKPIIHVNIVMFEDCLEESYDPYGFWEIYNNGQPWPPFNGTDYLNATMMEEALEDLEPHKDFIVTVLDVNMREDAPGVAEVFDQVMAGNGTFQDFYEYFSEHAEEFLDEDAAAQANYTAYVFGFATTDEAMGVYWGLGGIADNDYTTGTQMFTYLFNYPVLLHVFGYGFTGLAIHEFGHHVGLSHPHDGWDSGGFDFGPPGSIYGPFYYAWLGDESHTAMHYMFTIHDFGSLNKDALWRSETIIYINETNRIYGEIMESGQELNQTVIDLISEADTHAARAEAALLEMNYADAISEAQAAYLSITEAARLLGIAVASQWIEPWGLGASNGAEERVALYTMDYIRELNWLKDGSLETGPVL